MSAAIDVQDVTRDRRCVDQVQDRVRDVLDRRRPTHRRQALHPAVSTTLAAVAGSPMWPSTKATWSEAATSVDWVTFRELATTLKPRSTNNCTIPAPIPCDAPVTMAVFRVLFMVVYLLMVLLVAQPDR
jgi:hypothetical protein